MVSKRFKLVAHVMILLFAPIFLSWSNILQVKASLDIFQGDLILTSSNVTTIEGRFDINGSIIVENNATLILRDAIVNFTQTSAHQFSMIFRNPANGKPRLRSENTTVVSGYPFHISFSENSSANIYELDSPIGTLLTRNSSVVSIFDSTIDRLQCLDNSLVDIVRSEIYLGQTAGSSSAELTNCTVWYLELYDSSSVTLSNSSVGIRLQIHSFSVNCSVVDLPTGFTSSWNYQLNCSVAIGAEGYSPYLFLENTQILSNWDFIFRGFSNVTIYNSNILYLYGTDSSNMNVTNSNILGVYLRQSSSLSISNSTLSFIYSYDSGRAHIMDLTLTYLNARHSSRLWLVNSTSDIYEVGDQSRVYASWYLDAHVIDSVGQDVPSANVIAYYPNATKADSRLTDLNGWTRLILIEKVMNATGSYPIRNYTAEATFGAYSANTTLNMTGNQHATLTLESFVIPEFPVFVILPILMIITLLMVRLHRRKDHLIP